MSSNAANSAGQGRPPAGRARGAIRPARPEDAKAILDIYAPYVRDTAVSFEYEAPLLDEFKSRMTEIMRSLPYLVYELDELGGGLAGYAYASRYHSRAAYQWDVETSIYLAETAKGRGIGRALYAELFKQLTALGYYNAYACIGLPNPASVAFHEKFGFVAMGVMPGAGFKLGSWLDVLWMEKRLAPLSATPLPPRGINRT